MAEPLVGTACSACGKPRLGVGLTKEAYAPLVARVRSARLWHARAMLYVPLAALLVGLVAAASDYGWKSSARRADHDLIAEHGPGGARSPPLALAAPEPTTAFVLALVVTGLAGTAVYLAVGVALRARVRAEAARTRAKGATLTTPSEERLR